MEAVAEDAVLLGFLGCRADFLGDFTVHCFLLLGRPLAQTDQMALQPQDRIAQRPLLALLRRAIAAGVIRGRMALGAVGKVLNQGWAQVRPRAVRCPLDPRIDRERIVAIDTQPGDAMAHGARGKCRALRSGEARMAGNRVLVVDHVDDHRRIIDCGKGHCGVEIALCAGAFADIAGGNPGIALDRRRHCPAHRLRALRREVPRNGEEAVVARRIHDRQLAAFQPVGAVRIDLIDHIHHRAAAREQDALLAVTGKHHVVICKRKGSGHRCRLLAGAFHIEAGLALPLPAKHAVIECAGQRHRAEHTAQRFGIEPGIPGPDRAMIVIQNADKIET